MFCNNNETGTDNQYFAPRGPEQYSGAEQQLGAYQKLNNEFFQLGAPNFLNPDNCPREQGARQDSCAAAYPEIQPVIVPRDGGYLTIDEFDRVTQMQDANHRVFQFGYDNKGGEINQVSNTEGVWKRQMCHGKYTDQWKNQDNQTWKGHVSVSQDGYSFTSGDVRTSYTPDGRETKDYMSGGTETKDHISGGKTFYSVITAPDGKVKVIDYRLDPACKPKEIFKANPTAAPGEDATVAPAKAAAAAPDAKVAISNGEHSKENQEVPQPIRGSLQFKVEKGVTMSAKLNVTSSDLSIVHSKGGDVHARVFAPTNAPVTALQDGLVVYSYNHDPKVAAVNERRDVSVIGMSPADMAVIDQYKKANPDEDLVVMQCYDPASKGVRYEVYAGLSLANAVSGERFKAGSVLGAGGPTGYEFAARRGAISGNAIELTF